MDKVIITINISKMDSAPGREIAEHLRNLADEFETGVQPYTGEDDYGNMISKIKYDVRS
jgi:hypothetical protein